MLNIVADNYGVDSHAFFAKYKGEFEEEHPDDLRALQGLALPDHVESSETAKIYRGKKYRVSLANASYHQLIIFLEAKSKEGGDVLLSVIQTNMNIVTVDRPADDISTFTRRLRRANDAESFPGEDEGIPGHNPGSGNPDFEASSSVITKVQLGQPPMEKELKEDVRGDLEDLDKVLPARPGEESLIQTFDQRIKREESEDAPSRNQVPLPPSTARDVAMEVQKVREDRERLKIESRTGGIGPGLSVIMYTFHNTQDRFVVPSFKRRISADG